MAEPPDQLFNRRGGKHFRKSYSVREVQVGALIALLLLLIAGWVWWKGQRPEAGLFAAGPALVKRTEVAEDGRPPREGPQTQPPPAQDRGPIPAELVSGWTEGPSSSFGPDQLYEKIDGREGYYKSFGFVRLFCLTLSQGAERTIDLELYDLGTAANAAGAFAGELPEGAKVVEERGGRQALHRNSLLLARGRHYLRAIGSDESPPLQDALRALAGRFTQSLAGAELPWGHRALVAAGVAAKDVSYAAENAFSFGFARAVYVGLTADGETELFAVLLADETKAKALAKEFQRGFLELGEAAGGPWSKDRYLNRISGAAARGRFVAGVRGAADTGSAEALLAKLGRALSALPAEALVVEEAPPGAPEGY